jgi:hypothetical protein
MNTRYLLSAGARPQIVGPMSQAEALATRRALREMEPAGGWGWIVGHVWLTHAVERGIIIATIDPETGEVRSCNT